MERTVSFGKGNRALVIIPGLALRSVEDCAPMLPGLFRKFTSDWKVYVIDRPFEVPEGTTNADLADSYCEEMSRLGIADADIIGISQGGMIAQHIAVRHPEMVHRIVLGATLARGNSWSDKTLGRWRELAEAGEWETLNRDTYDHIFTAKYLQRYHKAFKKLIESVRPADSERFVRLIKACLTGGPFNDLDKIKCPVLVIGAGHDEVVGPEAAPELAGILGCELYIFEDYGHGVYDECPDFYPKALEFLSR